MSTMQEYKAHRRALKAQIKETKALLHQLEKELEEERIEMQHEEVKHLEEYLEKSDVHLKDFRTLSSSAMADLRKSLHEVANWFKGGNK